MAIADTIQSMYTNVGNVYDTITNVTPPSHKNIENIPNTIKESYLEIMNNGIDVVWDNWDKVTGTGTSFTLNNTIVAPTKTILKPSEIVQTNLPLGYTEVEYIQSSGTQYIDTGFKPNSNTKYDLVASVDAYTSSTSYIISAQGNGKRNNIYFSANGYYSGGYGSAYFNSTTALTIGTKYNMVLDKNELYLDGTLVHTFNTETFENTYNAYLFSQNSTGADGTNYSNIKLYSCKIYDNGTLVRDFVPCYRNSDNKVGLFDLANNVYYTITGTGSFAKGSDTKPTPDYPMTIHNVNEKNTIDILGENLIDFSKGYTTYALTTYSFENDIMTLEGNSTGTYNRVYFYITDLIKNNPGKILSLFCESVDLTDYTSSNRLLLQLRIEKTSGISYYGLYYTDGTYSYTIPNDTSDITSVSLNFYTNNSSTAGASTVIWNKPMLQFGDTQIPYKSYEGQNISANLSPNNLFKLSTDMIGNRTATGITTDVSNKEQRVYFKGTATGTKRYFFSNDVVRGTIPKGTYTLSSNHNGGVVLQLRPINSQTASDYSGTFTLTEDKYLINGYFPITNGTYYDEDIWVQLELGNQSTDYEKWYESIEYCKIGDYEDIFFKAINGDSIYDSLDSATKETLTSGSWYLKKEIGKLTLDGTESWQIRNTGTDNWLYYYVSNINPNADSTSTNSLCNRYPFNSVGNSNTNQGYYFTKSTKEIRIRYGTEDTTSNFETWLSNNNVTIYYQLASPTYTEVPETLSNQLEAIYKAKSKNGQTNVMQENTDLPFIINMSALV